MVGLIKTIFLAFHYSPPEGSAPRMAWRILFLITIPIRKGQE